MLVNCYCQLLTIDAIATTNRKLHPGNFNVKRIAAFSDKSSTLIVYIARSACLSDSQRDCVGDNCFEAGMYSKCMWSITSVYGHL